MGAAAPSGPTSRPIAGCDEINALVKKRTELRREKKWAEADRIKLLLQTEPYRVELFDRSDGVTVWRRVGEKTNAFPRGYLGLVLGMLVHYRTFRAKKMHAFLS